jgi:protein gp37
MGQTSIEWTDVTWNPVRGCSRVSPGCINCYAERQAARFSGVGKPFDGFVHIVNGHPAWTGKVELVEKHLNDPLTWKKPRRVFVNFMSDLFHEELSFADIDEVFTVMIAAPEHTYQILTKRPERMLKYFASGRHDNGLGPERTDYHLDQNIWLGVSVEDRARKNRIDFLRETPATVRFLSVEPLLEDIGELDLLGIHWVIVGGESGPGARPMDVGWVRSIVKQCRKANVACFVKQLGAKPALDGKAYNPYGTFKNDLSGRPSGLYDRKGGTMSEWPEDLQVREFPEVSHA